MNENPQENPYQAPQSDITATSQNDHDELATRGARFVAALIDAIISTVAAIPVLFLTGYVKMVMAGEQPSLMAMIGLAIYGLVAYVLIHGYFLNTYGQTIGKRIMKIFIADIETNEKAEFTTILLKRILPVTLVANIPLIGSVLAIIDALFIFKDDKRCVHDLIAKTRVLKVTGQ